MIHTELFNRDLDGGNDLTVDRDSRDPDLEEPWFMSNHKSLVTLFAPCLFDGFLHCVQDIVDVRFVVAFRS